MALLGNTVGDEGLFGLPLFEGVPCFALYSVGSSWVHGWASLVISKI